VVLEEARALGLEIEDLVAAAAHRPRLVTVREWVAVVETTFSTRTAATYRPYWRLLVAHHGDRALASLTLADLGAVVTFAVGRAMVRRPGSTGRASRETCVAALRAAFARAVAAGIVPSNPAAALVKPRRQPSRRRALDERELAELIDAVRLTSRDPDLDLLLVRFHLETGARRDGALHLRRRDLDEVRSTLWLREKGGAEREQPVSPSLLAQLVRHHAERADDTDAVLRTRDGAAITGRRYDTLFGRARRALPWSDRTPVSAHVLRHSAITAVGRIGGYPVAQVFAGHAASSITGRYLHATLAEVAEAVAVMTGEPHPLIAPPCRPRARCQRGLRLTPG
jgi:integrase